MFLFGRKCALPAGSISRERWIIAKVFVFVYLLGWTWFLIYLYMNWFEMGTGKKILLSIIEMSLTPDVSALKFLFKKYSDDHNYTL